MTSAELSNMLPVLLPVAGLFALLGWWLRGKKQPAAARSSSSPASASSAGAKPAAALSNSERQRLREAESKSRAAESALTEARAGLAELKKSSVPQETHAALTAELDSARSAAAGLESQLKKSREVQNSLQAQANDAGRKNQARTFALENELSAARNEIQQLKALSEPHTGGIKKLEAEIETVRARLRAVEGQLTERNAEVNALRARALAAGSAAARPPRTISRTSQAPGAPLNLLGLETPGASGSGTPAPGADTGAGADTVVENPVATIADAHPFPVTTRATIDVEGAFNSASAILGKRIQEGDLTVIEGISANLSGVLQAAGITSWQALADTPVERLETILKEAGPEFAGHQPGTWPEQAGLAAGAKWFQLKSLQEKLLSGRPPETIMA